MVGVFRRSLSFPNKPNPSRPSWKPPISRHTRSTSLPCNRSHPLISHLSADVSFLKAWSSSASASASATTAWLTDGLNLLKDVHDSLADLLQLPQPQESLCNRRDFSESVLEDLLRFVDAYGIFRNSVIAVRELHSAAQVALRKKDENKIASYLKSRTAIAKEIAKLAAAIRGGKPAQQNCHVSNENTSFADAELAAVIADVMDVTVSVSVALFDGVYLGVNGARKTKSFGLLKRTVSFGLLRGEKKVEEGIGELKGVDGKSLMGLRKMKGEEVRVVLERMRELEGCLCEIERGIERVFRSLINTRVSLLNAISLS